MRELAALLGVKFKRETDGIAHSNLITILSAEGEIMHQRPGLTGGLNEAAAALLGAVRSVSDATTSPTVTAQSPSSSVRSKP